jgi:hypothetical protein
MTKSDHTGRTSAQPALATDEKSDDSAAAVRQFTAEEIAQWEAENTTPLPHVRSDVIAGQRRRLAFEAARARTAQEKKRT